MNTSVPVTAGSKVPLNIIRPEATLQVLISRLHSYYRKWYPSELEQENRTSPGIPEIKALL